MKLIAYVLMLAVIVLVINLGSSTMAFIDIPSLLLVFGLSGLGVVSRHGLAGLKQLFDGEQNEQAVYTLAYGGLIAGMLAFPLSAVNVLSAFDGLKSIGPALAVTLLSPFYGLLIYLSCFMLNTKMKVETQAVVLMLPLALVSVLTFIVMMWAIKN